MIARILLAASIGLFAVAGCNRSQSASQKLVIAVIPKSTDHPFWKAVEAGAQHAGDQLGCEIRWQGPHSEAERQAQIAIVADMLQRGVDAICIAPNDKDALASTIAQTNQKVPVVVYDSGANTDQYTAFIATDNLKGGQIAGAEMLRLLGPGGGKVAVVRGIAGSESTTQREEGFISAVKQNPKITVVDVRGDNDELKSRQAAADILTREGDLAGFFGPSEPAAKGILGALADAGKTGKIKFVGFDGGEELARGMDEHRIDALVVQRPVLMGELAVKAAVAALRHQTVEKVQRIDPVLITQENKDQPDMRELLVPKVK